MIQKHRFLILFAVLPLSLLVFCIVFVCFWKVSLYGADRNEVVKAFPDLNDVLPIQAASIDVIGVPYRSVFLINFKTSSKEFLIWAKSHGCVVTDIDNEYYYNTALGQFHKTSSEKRLSGIAASGEINNCRVNSFFHNESSRAYTDFFP